MGNTNTTKVTLGNSVQNYTKTGQTVLNNCQNILRNANVPIPIVNTDNQGEKKLTGLVLEHAEDAQEYVTPAEEPTVAPAEEPTNAPVEEPTDAPVEETTVAPAEEETKSPVVQDDKNKEKTANTQQANVSVATTKNSFSDTNSTVNNVYTTLANKQSQLSSKNNLKSSQQKGLNEVGNFVNAMDDIESAGQSHIDALDEELPENGYVSGSMTSGYQRNSGEESFSFEANIKNSWQNKSKTFGIVASGSFGYTQTRTAGESFDITDSDLDEFYDDSDDEGDDNSEVKTATQSSARRLNRSADKSADSEDSGDSGDAETDLMNSIERSRTGNISINARYKRGGYTYGAGLVSNFMSDKSQMHDQFITVKTPFDVSADLMRRTHVSYDSETGERSSKAQMKLKLDILNRGKDEDISQYDETQEPVSDDTEVINKNDAAVQVSDDQDSDSENPSEERLSNIIKNDTITKVQEDAKKHKVKDGSGWDVDFKYDDNVCGFAAEYGINIINNPENKERFTVAPLIGAYDHTSPADDDDEAFQGSVGISSEYKKMWKDGESVNLSLTSVANRVMEGGKKPQDLVYTVFSGSYKNPRKKLNVDVDAGVIKSDVSLVYVEAGVSKQFKNLNVTAQGGYSYTKFGSSKDKSFQFLLTGTYNIPYGKKKK